MDNFSFYAPTYFAFGKDTENRAGELVRRFWGVVGFYYIMVEVRSSGLDFLTGLKLLWNRKESVTLNLAV